MVVFIHKDLFWVGFKPKSSGIAVRITRTTGPTVKTRWKYLHASLPTFLELSFPMEFQQRDVIVQGLAIVVVVYVGGGHSQGLGSRGPVFAGQIMVSYSDVDGIPGAYDAEKENIIKHHIFIEVYRLSLERKFRLTKARSRNFKFIA